MLLTAEAHLNTWNTIRSHKLKLHKIIKWLITEYLTVAPSRLVPLAQEQKDAYSGLKYYNNEFDILYAKLPVHIVKAFIAASKIKSIDSNGLETYYNFNQLRKYKDSILYGAKRAKYDLTPQFKQDLKLFIDSLKK